MFFGFLFLARGGVFIHLFERVKKLSNSCWCREICMVRNGYSNMSDIYGLLPHTWKYLNGE
jgi:hypothetical protein